MIDRNGFLVESVGVVLELAAVGKKAALSCARSHFCAIRLAACSAPSTREREGDHCGVCARRSLRYNQLTNSDVERLRTYLGTTTRIS